MIHQGVGRKVELPFYCSLIEKSLGMENLNSIHPGTVLLEKFLFPMDITAYQLASETVLPKIRISEIIKGNRKITLDTASRLAKFLGTSTKYWLDLQDKYDLEASKNIDFQNKEGVSTIVSAA